MFASKKAMLDTVSIVHSMMVSAFDFAGLDVIGGVNFSHVNSNEVQKIRLKLKWSDLTIPVMIPIIEELFV